MSTQITAQLVRELRDLTSAGMMDCKKALTETGGNVEKAVEVLRKKGLKSVEKRSGRVAAEGTIHSYIHAGGRIGVLLELNCETDFVARGDDFTDLARAISMHVAWASPGYLSREDVPESVLETEREIIRGQLKPAQEKMADKIIGGKIEKFYSENCLLEQLDAKDPSAKKTIGDLINDLSAKIGEKIELRRFVRYELGDGIEKKVEDFAAEVASVANH